MPAQDLDGRIEAVRRFNRFYTRRIGVLNEGLLESPYSLTESRVLYELAHRPRPAASELASDLGLDAGYLSRILRGFEERGLVARTPSREDRRQHLLALTSAGRAAFAPLDSRSQADIRAMLAALNEEGQTRLCAAMATVESLLGEAARGALPYIIRPPRPGDFGWVVHRHGVLYSREYGWNDEFEALVAEITAQFVRNFDPRCEGWWVAERDGAILGSVCLVRLSETVAKLRLLLVEPEARGAGIGRRLVDECIAFARAAGYRQITLWTNSVLTAARRLYERAGFRLAHQESNRMFGADLVNETWELGL